MVFKTGETVVYVDPNRDVSGTYSVFTLDNKVQNFYQQIKAHYTCSFSGILGPLILSTKIKEREWGSVNKDIIDDNPRFVHRGRPRSIKGTRVSGAGKTRSHQTR